MAGPMTGAAEGRTKRAGLTAPFSRIALRRHLEGKNSHIETPAAIRRCETLRRTMVGKLASKELNAEEEARRERK